MEDVQGNITTEVDRMIKEKLSAFYSSGVPVVDAWMAGSFFWKMKYHHVSLTSPCTITYLACLVLSFLIDTTMKMMFACNITYSRRQWMVAYLSTFLQITAATALMLFFNTTNTVTVYVLFGLVIVLLIYLFSRMFGHGIVPGRRWSDFEELLNRGYEMSVLVVALSIAGLSGKVLGYVKVEGSASNLNAGGHTAVAPESLLFYSAVSGLLVLLFCTVPPSLSSRRDRISVAKVCIPSIAFMALSFLVVGNVVAAEKILHQYVYLVCCPVVILAPLLYFLDAKHSYVLPETNRPATRSLSDEREDEAKLSKYLVTAGISPILVAVMAIHSKYGIGSGGSTVSLSWPWKAFVSFALCSILSHTVRIFILGKMIETKRYEISRKFWTYWTFVSIIISAFFALVLIYLHPDKVKNILF